MSQTSLADLIGKIQNEGKEAFEKAKAGPSGNWDVDLPLDLEYRLTVTAASYAPSKSTGRDQIALTYEVLEPTDYAGAMLQDYINPNPTQTWEVEKISKIFGALQADLSNFSDPDVFVKQFEGRTVVGTIRKWGGDGEKEPRNGIRYLNVDNGQTLSTRVKPPKNQGAANAAALRPEIVVPKIPQEQQPAPQPAAEEAPAPSPTTTTGLPGQSSGPNLPPGLK